MNPLLLEILIVLALIIANGLFAMSEMAVVAARKFRLRRAAESGDSRAAVALELARDPNRLLSTVQIGITVVSTLAGVFGGATFAERLVSQLRTVPALAPYAEAIGLSLVVAVISFLSLLFGELVPKRLALSQPENIATFVARPLRALSYAFVPLVRLLGFLTDRILRLFGVRSSAPAPVTEEEVQLLIREGTDAGVFEPAEHDLVRRVFRLGDLPARAFMTPRSDITWINAQHPPDQIRRQALETAHARLPVAAGSLDRLIGVIAVKEIVALESLDNLNAHAQPPLFLFEGMTGLSVLEQFKASATPMAIVLDEYGSVEGLITPTDLLYALVGDLPTTHTLQNPRAVRRPDGSWLLDATLPIGELRDLVPLPPFPAGDFDTLAGFILITLGQIPNVADQFTWADHAFEVVDMDGNRIDRVLLTPPQSSNLKQPPP